MGYGIVCTQCMSEMCFKKKRELYRNGTLFFFKLESYNKDIFHLSLRHEEMFKILLAGFIFNQIK